MAKMIDSCIWIDYLRKGTPDSVRKIADTEINDSEAVICEPIRFELIAGVSKKDRPYLTSLINTMPMISTPPDLWGKASELSTRLSDSGTRVSSIDLIIAAFCILEKTTLVTFDQHFKEIADRSDLDLMLIKRPLA
jgi:predicted nucleic acid-binding protein